jgi:hypothetical protein
MIRDGFILICLYWKKIMMLCWIFKKINMIGIAFEQIQFSSYFGGAQKYFHYISKNTEMNTGLLFSVSLLRNRYQIGIIIIQSIYFSFLSNNMTILLNANSLENSMNMILLWESTFFLLIIYINSQWINCRSTSINFQTQRLIELVQFFLIWNLLSLLIFSSTLV